jgi:hypothetical protein
MITCEVTPVPLNATICGLPVALSVILNVAFRAPFACGVNNTLIVQLAPAASVPVALQPALDEGSGTAKSPAFAPLIVKPVKFTAPVPLFITVTLKGALVVVSACEPNAKLLGVTVNVPPVAGVPVPVNVTVVVCGVSLPALVYVTVTVPLSAPVAVGVNVTFTTQLEPSVLPPTRVSGQLFVSPKFVFAAMLEIVTVLVPTFVIVTGCDALVVPCACPPKASVVGFAVTLTLDRLPACTNTSESNAKSFASATASLM